MKTVLVLSSSPTFAAAVAEGLHSFWNVVHRASLAETEPILRSGLVDLCILDFESDPIQSAWTLEKIQQFKPNCPLLVYLSQSNSEEEDRAYARGASYVLSKPLRIQLLKTMIERLLASETRGESQHLPMRLTAPVHPPSAETFTDLARTTSSLQSLSAVRDFSVMLTHSLDLQALLKQFLLLMRSVLGVNRAAIFLRQGTTDAAGTEQRKLRSAAAVGLSHDVAQNLELSDQSGIGGHLVAFGRILRRDEPTALADEGIQREFRILGAQVAIPIVDRESMLGIALLDGRLTGETLSNNELEAVFHLLEGLGLAIQNIRLHDLVASDNALLAGVLRELSSGCIVVNGDLLVAHANKAARQFFGRSGRRNELEFSDIPATLGNKVFQVLNTGTAIAPFRYEPPDSAKAVFQISIIPLYRGAVAQKPDSVLLVAEDRTQAEQLKQLELETANLRMARTMADRLAHEIGNALVPLSTHQQLLTEKYRDPEFRASLDHALADGVKRIGRLANQMRYLARDAVFSTERVSLKPLIEEAYQEAQKHHNQKPARLEYQNGGHSLTIAGDRGALKHAMAEVLLNALQANTSNGKIEISEKTVTDPNGSRWVQIAIEDAGEGFTAEAAKRVPEAFYTTRNVGLGLGLTVSRKIIEVHHGQLQIEPPAIGHHGLVRISLPLPSEESTKI